MHKHIQLPSIKLQKKMCKYNHCKIRAIPVNSSRLLSQQAIAKCRIKKYLVYYKHYFKSRPVSDQMTREDYDVFLPHHKSII